MTPDPRDKFVERFINNEMNEDELNDFHFLLHDDPALMEDVELSIEVDEALREMDVTQLRNQLKNIIKQGQSSSPGDLPSEEVLFGLPGEVVTHVNLEVNNEALDIGNYLQQLHIKNHELASKEIVREIVSDSEIKIDFDSLQLSEKDELLFLSVQEAVNEKDIVDLRSNLRSIAESISLHEHTFEEIEDFIDAELENDFAFELVQESLVNDDLKREINLHREVNDAIAEEDIMRLRAGLKEMMLKETSHSRTVDEIDDYLNDELDEMARSAFEEEMVINSGLMSEISFHKELNSAIGESDVMDLRAKLQRIANDEMEKNREKLGVKLPKRTILWYAAASIIILFAMASLFKEKSYTNQQLYTLYHQPYQKVLNVSRSASNDHSVFNNAINKLDHKDYRTALNMLNSINNNGKDNYSINFYSGMAYQELGEYYSAINSFEKVVKHGRNLLVEQSEWLIGLCYLRTEERNKAVAQFKNIVKQNGYYSIRSVELLKQIK